MKKSEQLFYLIKSMTKAEKRSFKLFSKIHSPEGKNNYILLFDTIDKMEVYDHQKLLANLKSRTKTKNISTLKNQLTDMILKSLRHDSSLLKTERKIHQNLDSISILYSKGLYSQASTLLEKTRKLAREIDDYISLDQLSMHEYKIALKNPSNEAFEHYISQTYPEVRSARKINDMLADFEMLAMKVRKLILESNGLGGEATEQRFNEIMEHPLMLCPVEDLPPKCQIEAHIIRGHYHYYLGNAVDMYFHRKTALTFLENQNTEPRVWLSQARFLLVGLSTFRMFKEFDIELKKIHEYIEQIPKELKGGYFDTELNMTLYNIRLDRDLDAGNFSKIDSYQQEVEQLIESNSQFIDTNLKMAFYSNFALADLANNKNRSALKWINYILDNPEMKSIRIDTQCYLRIKNIMTHFNLGNHELIEYLCSSTNRFFKQNDRNNPYALTFLKFANKHLCSPYDESKEQLFEQEANEMEELRKTDIKSEIAYQYIDVISWIRSIARNTTMEQIILQDKTMETAVKD